MDFSPNPNHGLIIEAVDAVCAQYDDTYWAECDEKHEFPWDFYDDMAAGGWVGIVIPEEFGGGDQGITEGALILNRVAASGAAMNGSTALHLTMFGLNPVVKFGNDRLKETFLPRAAAGDLHVAFGVTEPDAGTDLASLQCRAVRDGDEFVINGQKTWTSLARDADYIWLAARTNPDVKKHKGISPFCSEVNTQI